MQEDLEPLRYHGMEVLAPMVRAGTLPLRLECLRFGADLVYSEEIIDRKILGASRVVNDAFGTVDFVSPREKVAVFSTCAEERRRVILQLGTASAALATQAALPVCRDVRGVDVNMGCPKSFSVKGGMGAALLDTPDLVADILKTLRRELPASCSLTCKIRELPTLEKTRDFMRICEQCGIAAIAVHLRMRDERPAHPAHWDHVGPICDAVRIPVIVNGDFFSRRQISEFWLHSGGGAATASAEVAAAGPAGLMIARGALWNPAIFHRGEGEPPQFEEVVRRYVRTAVSVNATYQNTKWALSQILAGGSCVVAPQEFLGIRTKDFNLQLSRAKSMAAICERFGESFDPAVFPDRAHTNSFYRDHIQVVPAHAAVTPSATTEVSKPEGEMEVKRTLPPPEESPSQHGCHAEDASALDGGGVAKRQRRTSPTPPRDGRR